MLFATATEWVTRLTEAHRVGQLPKELARLRRFGLIIVDEVGYLPFEQDAANLFFQLVSSRYEHASLILTSNLPFSGWGRVFGDQAVAAAMIDRIVHHADVLTMKGASDIGADAPDLCVGDWQDEDDVRLVAANSAGLADVVWAERPGQVGTSARSAR